ncbi:hypothetical protein DLAC_05342 [Tieghemostelium lacteum]|uniref:Uncharacterized protein n=1 Tax=Tieghemostelium lacteum TaxID=361077 RepID=A0A151ZFQ5_TIELA|nr:hypothetical protein DLAC_05342 [Tieghemostelium lacteum]|eukprot:KYQ92765.1 hypothetical protein DLAC_05342 [Tieghemostelium lacteum]
MLLAEEKRSKLKDNTKGIHTSKVINLSSISLSSSPPKSSISFLSMNRSTPSLSIITTTTTSNYTKDNHLILDSKSNSIYLNRSIDSFTLPSISYSVPSDVDLLPPLRIV